MQRLADFLVTLVRGTGWLLKKRRAYCRPLKGFRCAQKLVCLRASHRNHNVLHLFGKIRVYQDGPAACHVQSNSHDGIPPTLPQSQIGEQVFTLVKLLAPGQAETWSLLPEGCVPQPDNYDVSAADDVSDVVK